MQSIEVRVIECTVVVRRTQRESFGTGGGWKRDSRSRQRVRSREDPLPDFLAEPCSPRTGPLPGLIAKPSSAEAGERATCLGAREDVVCREGERDGGDADRVEGRAEGVQVVQKR